MRIFYSKKSKPHNPLYEINNGEKVAHPENAKRVDIILDALSESGFQIEEISSLNPLKFLTKIHTRDFIQAVKILSLRVQKGEHLYPDIFSREKIRKWGNTLALIGQYSFDIYTPVMDGTYQAAISAASVAVKAASDVVRTRRIAYALTHPLGHHARPNMMGGYSYFNNAAVAAEYLSSFGKVAILDLDLHHGNGTQEIFYERDDVLFVSIHADPKHKFPYYWGYKEEKGENKGLGYTINYPLPLGIDNEGYQETLERVLENIKGFKPKFLVISLGFDTYKDDPIGCFKLTSDYYQKMAETIKKLDLPTVIIQEGGYDLKALGRNIVNFLRGITG